MLAATLIAGLCTVASTAPAASAPGQMPPAGGTVDVAASPTPTPARTGRPTTIAVLGDSISTATGTGQLGAEMKQNSWVTGTASWSMRGQLGIAGASAYTQAANGRRMNDMANQAWSLPANTQYVVVELGGNDLCRPSVAEMTPITTYRDQFRAGLAAIRARVPNALVFVASIPDIYNLWFIRGAPESVNPHVSDQVDQAGRARFFWDNFLGFEVPCQSLLSNPTGLSAGDIARRDQVRERNLAFNQVLAEECGAVLRCRYDDHFFFNFSSNRTSPPHGPLLPRNQWGFEDRDISHNRKTGSIDWSGLCPTNFTYDGCGDHFHPSVFGQQKLAAAGGFASYQFDADTTPPVVTLTPSRAPDGGDRYASEVTVGVTGTDAAGVRGYEVRVHQPDGSVGPWQAHVGATPPPVNVAAEGQTWVEARALDVNGNLSGSTTLGVNVDPDAFGQLSGTVTDSGTGAPVAGAWVAVLRTSDLTIAGGGEANAGGDYLAEVPAGSYFLYVIDPTGGHTAGFHGPPTTVVVPGGGFVDADPAMAPTRGTVTGTITETGPNTAIAGSWAIALNNGGVPETGVVANGSGQFSLPGLSPGNHFVTYVDPAGAHPTRFYPNSPNVPSATLVNVTAGGTATRNGSLPTQTAVGTGAALTGTVTQAGTGIPLANVFVIALNAADFSIARGGVTNGSGAYNLDVVAGGYKIVYLDATGLHNAEWNDNQPATNLGGAATVTAPAATNASLDPNTGSMSGSVTDDPSGDPVAAAWVLAIGPNGIAGGAITAANATYIINNLPPGTYRAAFVDPTGGHTLEYHQNSPDFAGATPFNITAASNTTINAALAQS